MKAYIIGRGNITNEQKAEAYKPLAASANKKFGGKYLARGGKFINKEGAEYERNVIIEFPTYEKALEWYNSDLYKPLKELRQKGSEGNIIIIKGV